MPDTFRAALSLIVLNLSLIVPAFAQSNSFAGTPMRPLSADEESVRDLTDQYARALVAGDLDAMRKFWNPKSANLASHFRSYKNLFAHGRIEFTRPEITRLEVATDRAVSFFTADERRFDNKTGAVLLPADPLYGACRAFEWIKTGSGWQIEKEFLVQDELAGRLGATRSDQERDEILEKEKRFVNKTLLNSLGMRVVRHLMYMEYDVVMHYVELQRAVAAKIGDEAGIAASWLNLGSLKHTQDEHEIGLAAMLKALALYEASGNKRGMAITQENLSHVYCALGNYRRAFDTAQKSLRLSEDTKNRRGVMVALTQLGFIYHQQNNAEQALAHLEKALALAQELGDSLQIATLHHEMARQYMSIGNHDRALPIYQQLLKQMEGYGDRGGAAMLRDMIAQIYKKQKRYDEALSYHSQALAQIDPAKHKQAAVAVLNNMSLVYIAQENYAEALTAIGKAVSLSRETGRKDDLGVALTNLGYAQAGLNRLKEARESFAEAVSIMENLRTLTAGGAEEQQRYFERGLRAHHGLLGVLVKENEAQAALLFAEHGKARTLLDILQQGRAQVNKAMTATEQAEERRLKFELTQLNKQLARLTHFGKQDSTRVGEVQAKLEKARLNYEAFQNALYSAHPELKSQRGEAPIINAQELANLLPNASSALLEYVVTDDKTYLFAVTRPSDKAGVKVEAYTLPLKRDDLAKQIESFRQQLATRDLGFRPAAVELYNLLLKPAQAQLRGKNNIVIAPDSSLWDLPFHALVNNNNRFVIESAAISYAPSLTVLREMTKRRMKSTSDTAATLLAFGNPSAGGEATKQTGSNLRNHNLDPLPEAVDEVQALGRLYGPSRSRIYVGNEAREDLLKTEAGKASILHFTTHGTLNNASPMYSHLTLADGGPNEDGLLEAWELMQLDLNAELAVLSACETARGRIGAGEGMIGFSWAMFIAGVPSIVVSQWKVESAGTRDLMVNFHRALISPSGSTKTDALRHAALKLMKNPQTSHPFYWAGFVLVGNGR